MPTVRPFRGLRYKPDKAGDIADNVAPPYDIIYDKWRDELYARSPYNIVRLIKTREEPGGDEKAKYARAADYIDSWMRDGVLEMDDEPAVYVRADTYKVRGEKRTRYGFIALLRLEEFGKNVHPHERTLTAPKADRLNLIKATGTNLSQIFSIYRDSGNDIQRILEEVAKGEPDISFTDEHKVKRKMWIVRDRVTISRICSLMEEKDIIIADGHHRYETALDYRREMAGSRKCGDEPFDYVSMYFSSADDTGMTILPTHRKISGVSTYHQETFFSELEKLFDVEYLGEAALYDVIEAISHDAERNNNFGIYTCDGYGTARLKNPSNPKELDVNILHDIIIEKLLGISKEDIAAGRHVHFCKSPEHAVEDVANYSDQISFIMNPVTPEELFRTVLKGERMPQKSTYFYPKTISGLVMYRIAPESFG